MDDKKIAVLIDADNISSKYVQTIFDELKSAGTVTYRRIYGDFTSTALSSWSKILLDYSLTPIQQYANTTHKNCTDSALIIDAMDILYSGNVDGFCIVSSDSDFTRLAVRLREAGKTVIGMGEKKTVKAFVTACNDFKYVDILSGSVDVSGQPAPQKAQSQTQAAGSKKSEKKAAEQEPTLDTVTTKEEIKTAIIKIFEEDSDDESLVLASKLGYVLKNMFSDFDCRNYGFKKLVPFLESLGFKCIKKQDPNNSENPGGLIAYIQYK